MSPAAAAAATLSVMWLCAFKQAGNYILPYSYGALHGSALGLVTLALLVAALRGRKPAAVKAPTAEDRLQADQAKLCGPQNQQAQEVTVNHYSFIIHNSP